MMDGNKGRYFCLQLSFIGWYIFAGLTFGILEFWVLPYVNTVSAEFYKMLKREQGLVEEETEPVVDDELEASLMGAMTMLSLTTKCKNNS